MIKSISKWNPERKSNKGITNMLVALYAVVFTQEQHDTLMRLIDECRLYPTNSFHIMKNPEEVKFDHLVDGGLPKDNDMKTATSVMCHVHIRIFYPILDVEFFKSVAKLLSTLPTSKKSSINELFTWDESNERFVINYSSNGMEMLKEVNLQHVFNCLLSQDWD